VGIIALLACSLPGAVLADDNHSPNAVTVISATNLLLSSGASALAGGHVQEGLRLTLEGLNEPAMPRDVAAGHANACAGFVLTQQWDDALEHCNRALSLDNTNWRAYNNRAAVYVAKGLLDLAIQDIEAGLELAPNSHTLHESLRIAQRNKKIIESRSRHALPS
jgi:tetratricopeptide (TPR) repeat protein